MSDQAQKQPFWENLNLPTPGALISAEAYAALPEVNFHIEWHNGVVVYPNWNEASMSPAPSLLHQSTVMRVIQLLLAIVPDGEVFTAPTDVRLGTATVQPDVLWVAAESSCMPADSQFIGPPNLIVEVLSPSNTKNDRVTKFDLYETQAVQEYWMVNPDEEYVEVYTHQEGIFHRVGAYKSGQSFTSPLLAKVIDTTALFGDTPKGT